MHEWTNQLPLLKVSLDLHHPTCPENSTDTPRYASQSVILTLPSRNPQTLPPLPKRKKTKNKKTPSPCETQSMLIKTSSSSTRTARTSTTDSPSSSRTRNTATRPAAPGLCVQSPRSAGGCFRACRFSSTRTGRRGIFRWMWLGYGCSCCCLGFCVMAETVVGKVDPCRRRRNRGSWAG